MRCGLLKIRPSLRSLRKSGGTLTNAVRLPRNTPALPFSMLLELANLKDQASVLPAAVIAKQKPITTMVIVEQIALMSFGFVKNVMRFKMCNRVALPTRGLSACRHPPPSTVPPPSPCPAACWLRALDARECRLWSRHPQSSGASSPCARVGLESPPCLLDRKSTRLNSSHT